MNELVLKEKLKAYANNRSIELRNELVMDYTFIVRNVAKSTRNLYQSFATFDDAVNNGILTLIDCIEKYDASKGVEFEPYAYARIKNATIDFIRKNDYLPRRVRQTAKEVSIAYNELANKNMHEPTDVELAQYMNIPLEELNHHYNEISSSNFLSVEELTAFLSDTDYADSSNNNPTSILDRKYLKEILKKAIKTLNEKEILVISLCYYENLKLKEIAEVLDVSDARVSQIHSKAILKLKKYILEYGKELLINE